MDHCGFLQVPSEGLGGRPRHLLSTIKVEVSELHSRSKPWEYKILRLEGRRKQTLFLRPVSRKKTRSTSSWSAVKKWLGTVWPSQRQEMLIFMRKCLIFWFQNWALSAIESCAVSSQRTVSSGHQLGERWSLKAATKLARKSLRTPQWWWIIELERVLKVVLSCKSIKAVSQQWGRQVQERWKALSQPH